MRLLTKSCDWMCWGRGKKNNITFSQMESSLCGFSITAQDWEFELLELLLTGKCIWVGVNRNLAVVQQLQLHFLVWNSFSNKLRRNDSFYRRNSLTI